MTKPRKRPRELTHSPCGGLTSVVYAKRQRGRATGRSTRILEQQDDGGGVGDHQKPRYSMKPIEPSLRAGREVCSSISAADEVLKLPSVVAGILNRLDLLANLPGAVDGAPLRANYHALRQVQMCRQRPRDCGRTVSLHTMRHRLVATRNRRYPRPPIRRHRCYM